MARGIFVGRTRHPLVVILLGIVTFFVYTGYWYYTANKEMQRRGLNNANAPVWTFLVTLPVLQALAVHQTVANLRDVYVANNVHRDPSPMALALLALPLPYIGPIIASAFVQSGLNHVWHETRERVIHDGPEEKDLQCPQCESVFEIRKNPYSDALVTCPGCDREGVV